MHYRRRISSEEAREGFVLVEKSRLDFFPRPERSFTLVEGRASRVAKVESYPCECRGPEKPHEHWFIRRPGLVAGEDVEFVRMGDGTYELRVGAPK